MTTVPSVELRFNPTDLRPGDLPKAGAYLGSPGEALEAALAVTRARMVDRMKAEIRGLAEPTSAQVLSIADLAWQTVFWQFRKISAPVIADAYLRAYRKSDAGDVPLSVLYDLADKHAEKVGEYFHTSSRAALAEGFNAQVNRRLPAKAAAGRVMDAYGLTPRQMRAYTSAKQLETPVTSTGVIPLRARARAYIDKSFTTRIKKLSAQEEHNIDQQAQQFAWMWLTDKGRLNERAQKLWITAKDERVCEICGPLHGQKVGVNERFVTKYGEFWTPGLHPNCRCVVRLLEHRFSKSMFKKADWWREELHPRDAEGQFTTKARQVRQRPKPKLTTTQRLSPEEKAWLAQMSELHLQEVREAVEEGLSAGSGLSAATEGLGVGLSAGLTSSGGLASARQELATESGLSAPELTSTTGLSAQGLTSTSGLAVEAITASTPTLAPVQVENQAAVVAAAEPKIETEPLVHMPQPGEIVPIGEKIYIMDDEKLMPSDHTPFTDQDYWGSKKDVMDRAFGQVNSEIEDKVAEIVDPEGPNWVGISRDLKEPIVEFSDSEGYTVTLRESEVRKIIEAIAYGAESKDQFMDVFWFSPQHDATHDRESRTALSHLGDAMGVHQEDFVQHVYVTDHAVEGNWEMLRAGGDYGEAEWLNVGVFDVVSDSLEEYQHEESNLTDHGLIRWIHVRPTEESE